jgi:hypothetical protein
MLCFEALVVELTGKGLPAARPVGAPSTLVQRWRRLSSWLRAHQNRPPSASPPSNQG